jgi:hypothetical protein
LMVSQQPQLRTAKITGSQMLFNRGREFRR